MSSTTIKPQDLEELAAFVDGRLSGARKEAVERRLVTDDGYYELYLETVELLEGEAGEATGPAEVVAHPAPAPVSERRSRSLVSWWVPVAAVAAAATIAVLVVVPPFLARPFSVLSVVGALEGTGPMTARFGEEWDLRRWTTFRSAQPDSAQLTPEQAAYRSGVHLADLAVAARLGDREAVAREARRLEGLVAAGGFLELEPVFAELGASAGDPELDAATLQRRVAGAAADLADTRAGVELLYLEVGQFARATELAARAGDGRLFAQRPYRRLLAKLGHRQLGPEAAALLQTIAGEIEAEVPNWQRVAESAAGLDSALGG